MSSTGLSVTCNGGRVDVSVGLVEGQDSREMLEIRVADTGVGIKEENRERIFERFYQVEQEEPEHQSTGSGIGLSLVRDFVTLHEGTVRVVDNVGSGSVFLVELPVKHVRVSPPKPAPLTEEVEEHEELLPGMEEEALSVDLLDDMEDNEDEKEKPLALIVDDNEDLVAFMKDSLSLYFRIQSASNGREAWQKISELMPDIIVSDVMMPEMDGNELCRWVKTDKRTSDIPMILLTARQAVEDKVEGLTIGADDYVTKPFTPMELMARVNSQLRRYRKFMERLAPRENIHVIGGLEINEDTVEVSVDGEPVRLTPIEYKILLLLAKNPGRVFSSEEIYERVWQEKAINTDTIMVHVRNIREKIELDPKNPKYLKVVWGVGYKIEKQG